MTHRPQILTGGPPTVVRYKLRGQTATGVVIGWEHFPGQEERYIIRNAATGREHRVSPSRMLGPT